MKSTVAFTCAAVAAFYGFEFFGAWLLAAKPDKLESWKERSQRRTAAYFIALMVFNAAWSLMFAVYALN